MKLAKEIVAKGGASRWGYLAFVLIMLCVVRRATNKDVARDNMLSFFAGMLPSELSHKLLAVNAAVAYNMYKAKPLVRTRWVGSIAAFLQCIVSARLAGIYKTNVSTKYAIREAMKESDVAPELVQRVGDMNLMHAFRPRWEEKTTDLLMDVYKHRDAKPNAPILLFVHGGGWIIGSRVNPPLPLVHQVATLGWVVCVIDYQLSPRVAFPEHLIDTKRAIAYLRKHARKQFDANPNFIVAAGESAGGHLASLLALTSAVKSFQPGFEDVDTSVCGCIDSYGVHDFKDSNGLHFYKDKYHSFQHFVELVVMQKKLNESGMAFESASPISWLAEDKTRVPPFLVAHGTLDTVVPCGDSRLFFEQLQSYRQRTLDPPIGDVSDVFLEIPGAHHAFNYLLSPRAFAYGQAVCAFLINLFQKTKNNPTQCPPSRVLSDMDQQASTMPAIITAARL